ncbi:uncharacterized protein [Primulina eburnea]|uniref:uncharacterized protein n=1 Tax=Primulina eburnea TaxID=1245227 RepID=UPI003C6C70A4
MANTNPSVWNMQTGRSPVDDQSNPYFLHHSDNPGLLLVSQQLTGENFPSWSRATTIALSVKNKLGFIDGSIPKPPESDLALTNAWIRNNNIVISWLLNSVSKEISASVLFVESAEDIWKDLKDRFQQSNAPRIFQLRRELVNLRQDQDPVGIYFTKLKAIWEELNQFRPVCNCGKCNCNGVKNIDNYVQMDYAMTFLMGLNDSFAHVRSQVLLLDPLPSISRIFASVIQEERQRAIGAQSNINNPTNDLAFSFKGEQHQSQYNNKPRNKFQKGRPYCTSCNAPGHTVETCYKIHGYPPGYKNRSKSVNRSSPAQINQVSGHIASSENRDAFDDSHSNVLHNFDKNQMEQLMAMFVQHLSAADKKLDRPEVSHDNFRSGNDNQEDDWQG